MVYNFVNLKNQNQKEKKIAFFNLIQNI